VDRLEVVRQVVDDIVRQQPDREESRCGFVHLYGVSALCVQLALRRGLDPQMAALAGMLHDIWTYKTADSADHARLSALEAGRILRDTGCFAVGEIAVVCDAIEHHSAKDRIDGEMAELLKDADVFQHYLYNPALGAVQPENPRLRKVCAELGLERR